MPDKLVAFLYTASVLIGMTCPLRKKCNLNIIIIIIPAKSTFSILLLLLENLIYYLNSYLILASYVSSTWHTNNYIKNIFYISCDRKITKE